tara:strand:- start:918 stop:1277 length:360 start_codon:yes stop_codon:yes gene_type:complete
MSNYTKLLQGKEREDYISKRFPKKSENIVFPINKMGSSDIESIDIVIKAYKKYANGENIEYSGFNDQSGYVYIALSNGVQIISNFGQEVEFLVTQFEDGEEFFLDTYKEAMSKYLEINM